jgi:hypothetical protein
MQAVASSLQRSGHHCEWVVPFFDVCGLSDWCTVVVAGDVMHVCGESLPCAWQHWCLQAAAASAAYGNTAFIALVAALAAPIGDSLGGRVV